MTLATPAARKPFVDTTRLTGMGFCLWSRMRSTASSQTCGDGRGGRPLFVRASWPVDCSTGTEPW